MEGETSAVGRDFEVAFDDALVGTNHGRQALEQRDVGCFAQVDPQRLVGRCGRFQGPGGRVGRGVIGRAGGEGVLVSFGQRQTAGVARFGTDA
jgi:hypothetical protein